MYPFLLRSRTSAFLGSKNPLGSIKADCFFFTSYIKPAGKYSLHSLPIYCYLGLHKDTYKHIKASSLQCTKNFLSLLTSSKDSSLIDLALFLPQAVINQTEAIKIFLFKLRAPKYEKCLHKEIFWWVLGGHPALRQVVDFFNTSLG